MSSFRNTRRPKTQLKEARQRISYKAISARSSAFLHSPQNNIVVHKQVLVFLNGGFASPQQLVPYYNTIFMRYCSKAISCDQSAILTISYSDLHIRIGASISDQQIFQMIQAVPMLMDSDPNFFNGVYNVCKSIHLWYGIDSLTPINKQCYKKSLFILILSFSSATIPLRGSKGCSEKAKVFFF